MIIDEPEIWVSPTGERCALMATAMPADPDFDDEWYPEAPGQRPPRSYAMVTDNAEIVHRFTVFPVEPWSPYDAAFDLLVRHGWTPPPPTPEDLAVCEHGLAAQLCAGPGHYPAD